jgi:hypothetical protein
MIVRQWLLRWPTLALLGAAVLVAAKAPAAEDNTAAAKNAESEARLKRDITYLASDECEGRGPMTKGFEKAAAYVANEFKKAGLKSGNPDGSYFQPFTVPGKVFEAPTRLVLERPTIQHLALKEEVQFVSIGLSGSGKVTAPAVFAGYGLTVKNQTIEYDDYTGLDVEGKVVVVLRDSPRGGDRKALGLPTAGGFRAMDPTSLAVKLENAEKHKAAAVLVVNDAETAKTGDDLFPYSYTAMGRVIPAKIPTVQIRRSVLQSMLQSSALVDLRDLEQDIDRDLKPRSLALTGWNVDLEVKIKQGEVPLKNVVGVLEGNGPLAKEYVVISSHLDHLGYGGAFGSLARLKRPVIHHGADDNGSGSTSVMELARRFAAIPNRQGRSLVFITFSGEEMGLIGSQYYANHPLFPIADTIANLNLDMVGRLRAAKEGEKEFLLVEGANTGKDYKDLVEELNKKYDFLLKYGRGVPGNSDHFSFYLKNIPVLFFWTDVHPDYHRPSDTADKINVPGMRKIVDLSEEVLTNFTTREKRPEFVKVTNPPRQPGAGGGTGPSIGIRPKYGDDGEGVLLDGVSEGGLAEKAGLKAGDRIIEVAGKPVKSLEGYVEVMRTIKAEGTLELTILRDGKKQTLTIKFS